MIEYSSREINQLFKQYSMFLNSLHFIEDESERNKICFQMTKLIEEILAKTNNEYEEKYKALNEQISYSIVEEKERLERLLTLINGRREYITKEIDKNKLNTNISIDSPFILGEDNIIEIKKKIRIIDNYKNNREKIIELTKELKSLDSKLVESIKKIKTNNHLNKELEDKMILLFDNAFKELKLYGLLEEKDEIISLYDQLHFAYNTARDNIRIAKETGNSKMIIECDDNLSKITIEYNKVKEEKLILDLLDIYNNETSDYLELKDKRDRINTILRDLDDTELYKYVFEEIDRQYNTIRIEEQDVNTYNSLAKEKEIKNSELFELEEKNNSQEYLDALKVTLENEKKHQEMLIAEQRKKEYEERQKKLIEENKLQEERIKRQRLIDEQRKKEQQKRINEMLNAQKESVIISSKKTEEIKLKDIKEELIEEDEIVELTPNESIFIESPNIEKLPKVSDDFDYISVIKNNNLRPEKIKDEEIKRMLENNSDMELIEEDVAFPEINTNDSNLESKKEEPVVFKGWFN